MRWAEEIRKWGDSPMKIKDISDWLKLVVWVLLAAFAYQHLVDVVQAQGMKLAAVSERTTRIERYLSSQDKDYWKKAISISPPGDDE